ncbi:MAG TPA: pyridoxamine 5'-phosphate oxidase family protein [Brevibacillus sp.]|nr:pyridoxamine 5'-phosphate oxidase family protein [Brevibacillus sp.]
MAKVETQLSNELAGVLQGQTVVFLSAVEPESKQIYATALSWVYATDESTIRFAIDSKSDFVKIIDQDPRVVLNFIGLESSYSISGEAAVKVRKTEELTLKMALIEVKVKELRDIMFYGGKIVQEPAFVKTYKPELVKQLDDEIRGALHNV